MFDFISTWFKERGKFSHYFMVFGLGIALASLFGTDPDLGWIQVPFGADVIAKLSALPAAVFGVFLLFICTKALHDFYDMKKIYDKAVESTHGAGLLAIAVAISRVALAIVVVGLVGYFIR